MMKHMPLDKCEMRQGSLFQLKWFWLDQSAEKIYINTVLKKSMCKQQAIIKSNQF